MRLLFFGFIICISLALFATVLTHAFFVNTVTSTGNSFATAAEFPTTSTPTPTLTLTPTPDEENPTPQVGHIVINEVSPSGSESVEWIEIFNGGSAALNMAGWSISDATSEDDVLPSVEIPVGAYAVIVTNNSVVITPAGVLRISIEDNELGSGLNFSAAGDLVELKNGTSVIDIMHYGTAESGWPLVPIVGQTISRIPNGVDTDSGADWNTNTNSTIGISN